MGYRTLRECVDDLERHGQLVRIDAEVDARLEVGRDSAARLCRRRAGAALHAREGLPLPDGEQPVRHDGARAVHVSRQRSSACGDWSS